jgi:hypothetical protein
MPPAFNPVPILGPIELGVFLSCFLFGVVTVQVFIYFTNFPQDRRVLKALVILIF